MLLRLSECRAFKRQFASLDLSSYFVFESLRCTISDCLRVSFSEDDWPDPVIMPALLQRYLMLSQIRVFAVDDIQQMLHMGMAEKSKFLSFLARLVEPPLNMSLILCGPPEMGLTGAIAEAGNRSVTMLSIEPWRYAEDFLCFLASVELSMTKAKKARLTEGNLPSLIFRLSGGLTGTVVSSVRAIVVRSRHDPDFNYSDERVMQAITNGWEI
ncbi:hypothetical protein [Pseudomonas corrugata]|uniref:hypothetical protein n=1 Tax=Pseudomonas corrugata TaxID=47879 RepID=UPI00138DFBD9|nr:hypothetical protein [Pseudomonas corrugata]